MQIIGKPGRRLDTATPQVLRGVPALTATNAIPILQGESAPFDASRFTGTSCPAENRQMSVNVLFFRVRSAMTASSRVFLSTGKCPTHIGLIRGTCSIPYGLDFERGARQPIHTIYANILCYPTRVPHYN